jgi:hypothetical protein
MSEEMPVLRRYKANLWECTANVGGVERSSSAVEWPNMEGFDLTVGENNPIQIDWEDLKVMKIIIDRLSSDMFATQNAKNDE